MSDEIRNFVAHAAERLVDLLVALHCRASRFNRKLSFSSTCKLLFSLWVASRISDQSGRWANSCASSRALDVVA